MKKIMSILMILAIMPTAIAWAGNPQGVDTNKAYGPDSNWEKNTVKVKGWEKNPTGVYLSKDGKVIYFVGRGKSLDLQMSIDKAMFEVRQNLLQLYGNDQGVIELHFFPPPEACVKQFFWHDGKQYHGAKLVAIPLSVMFLPDSTVAKLPVLR